MSNLMTDQIQDLTAKEQEQFHRYVQRSLRRRWAKANNKTEKENDDAAKRRT